MPAMSRVESEKREAAVLKFFMENPAATGDEAQRALMSGKLTGAKGPPMGIGRLFRVRRQAQELLRDGARTVSSAPMAPEKAAPLLAKLRDLTGQVQVLLKELPDVAEVRIARDTARVVRTVTQEETF